MPSDQRKTKAQLIEELESLRKTLEKREIELSDLEDKYSQVVENSNAAIIIIQDQVIKFSNVKMSEITGYTMKELDQKPFLDFVHPDHADMLKARHERRLKGEQLIAVYDFKSVTKNNEIKWFETKPMKIMWEDQPAALCFVSDVTARKVAEEELRKSELRFKTVLESTGFGYYEVDAQGTFTFINEQLAVIYDRPRDRILGHSYREFTDETNAEKVYQVFNRIFKEMLPMGELDNWIIRPDGSGLHIHISITLIQDDEGVPTGFKGLIQDITKQKENERTLRELHRKNIDMAHAAGMAEMASNTLHNVGNILNSVKTSGQSVCDLLKNDPFNMVHLKKANNLLKENLHCIEDFITEDPNGKKLMEYLAILNNSIIQHHFIAMNDTKRLMEKIRLIENVVVAQQAYAGLGVHFEYHSLEEVVEDSLTLKSTVLQGHQIKLRKFYASVPNILIQKARLIHVVINLITNACDALLEMPPDKKMLDLVIDEDKEKVFLKVIDTGKGLADEEKLKIFTHGYTTKQGGHGFGLHSSAIYMQEMNGRITVASEGLEKGATFTLEFDKKESNASENQGT